MLRCRDACVRCAGSATGGKGPIMSTTAMLGRQSTVWGIASGLSRPSLASRPLLAASGSAMLQQGSFSTSTAKNAFNRRDTDAGRAPFEREGKQLSKFRTVRLNLEQNRPKRTIPLGVVDEEMRWLRDPSELADRVKRLLSKGELEKAATLTREAQRTGSACIVSWNHLIDHQMQIGKPDLAFKLYNDMKKRGRRPDAHTYTIMFRGLAMNTKGLKMVPTALSIYESLCDPKSEVKPSTIHSNAALNVCARHGDMDALWKMAGKLPETGPGAPDSRTYTTILNALKANTENETRPLDPKRQMDGIEVKKVAAVKEAKRMWTDIVTQWRDGQLVIDSQLVSAMGNILVFGGRRQDCRDVLSLLEQTMGITHFGRKQEEIQREKDEHFKTLTNDASPQRDIIKTGRVSSRTPGKEEPEESLGNEEEPELSEEEEFKGLFEPVQPTEINAENKTGHKRLPKLFYPSPTNSELSLIMEACRTLTNALGIGKSYWDTMTSKTEKYKIVPDSFAYHEYLRLLRVCRASGEALRFIREEMSRQPYTIHPKTFLIAISTCLRDRRNPNVFDNANKLLDEMNRSIRSSRPNILAKYQELVYIFLYQDGRGPNAQDAKYLPAKLADKAGPELHKEILSSALRHLRPHIERIKVEVGNSQVDTLSKPGSDTFPSPVRGKPKRFPRGYESAHPLDAADALSVLNQTKDLYDRILGREVAPLLSPSSRVTLNTESRELKSFLVAQAARGVKGQSMLRPRKKTAEDWIREREGSKVMGQKRGGGGEWLGKGLMSSRATRKPKEAAVDETMAGEGEKDQV